MYDHETVAPSSRTLASAIDRLEEMRSTFDAVVRVAQTHAEIIGGSNHLKGALSDAGLKVAPAPSSIVDRVHYEIDGLNQRLHALAEQQTRIGLAIGRPEKGNAAPGPGMQQEGGFATTRY